MKICTKCKIEKQLIEFSPDKRNSTGYTSQCKICKNLYLKEYFHSDRGHIIRIKAIKKWANSENGKKSAKIRRVKYDNTPQGRLQKSKLDKKYKSTSNGKSIKRAISANYRAAKLQATPSWLTKDHFIQIKMFHQLANYLTEVTEIEWHVDHIIPLQGENISGLHVPWNLRVITKKENESKGNRL